MPMSRPQHMVLRVFAALLRFPLPIDLDEEDGEDKEDEEDGGE